MRPVGISRWLCPGPAVVVYFDPHVAAGPDVRVSGDRAARFGRFAVDDGVGGEFAGAQDDVVGAGAVGQ
jgi:hypothetical protein